MIGLRPVVLCLLLLGSQSVDSGTAAAQSLNVTQLANLDEYTQYSDIWGYRASNGKELAIIGTLDGTSFIDTTNPGSPGEVKFIAGPNSLWRDIKTYGDHAYIVNETEGGLQIVDLSNVQNPSLVKSDTTFFHTAHNLYADVVNGHLYVCGPDDLTGFTVLDLNDPENPTLLLNFTDFYVHDIHVQNGVAYAAAIYLGALAIIDVASLPSYTVLDTEPTVDTFCHNTWATPDDSYCLTTDEVSGGHLQIFDVTTKSNASSIAEWTHPTDPTSIIHNVTVNGDLSFISWYKTGMQVLDIADPYFPQRVGFYDTFPDSGSGFDGAWGVYPFQPSGNIYVSDLSTGLHILSFDPDYGEVVGHVTDASTLLPIEGVEVVVVSEFKQVMTLSDGRYRLAMVPGSYDVILGKFGYESDTVNVVVSRGSDALVDVALVPLPAGSLGGFVGEFGAYQPVVGAPVILVGTPLSTSSDAAGHYEFPSVPEGAYICSINLFGYGPVNEPLTIVTGTNTLNFALLPPVFIDDLETASGWTVGAAGDEAVTGIWELADPEGTGGGSVQPEDDHTPSPGILAFVTGAAAGVSIGSFDVDGGVTTLLSPVLDLSGVTDPVFSYHRWYVNDAGASPDDVFEVDVSNDGGGSWVNLETTSVSNNFWRKVDHPLTGVISITSEMRFRFRASDLGGGSVVEAAVDDIQVSGTGTTLSVPPEPGTLDRIRLLSSSPNPFHHATRIRYQLAGRTPVRIMVFDAGGRRVAVLVDAIQDAGPHEVRWDGRNMTSRAVSSGVYFLKLVTPGEIRRQKIVLAR